MLEVMIDAEDLKIMDQYKGTWGSSYDHCTNGFYISMNVTINKKIQKLYLHRIIMNCTDPTLQIDHLNHNTLDNRKSEMKIVTRNENQWNKRKVKGYYWNTHSQKFLARICKNNKYIELGSYTNEQDARDAYLAAKEIYHVI